jgi:hypothetical protein
MATRKERELVREVMEALSSEISRAIRYIKAGDKVEAVEILSKLRAGCDGYEA